MEPKKPVILKNLHILLQWPIWTVISVSGTVVLLILNFTEFQLGAQLQLGRMLANDQQTANILGAIQLAVKIHDYTLVSSIFRIAQQWVHGYLTGDGILLGLLGAEEALARPSFLVSRGYKSAVRYGFSGPLSSGKKTPGEPKGEHDGQSRRNMRFLAGLLFLGCIISSLVGPASGVLMIPHIHWYLDEVIDYNHPEKYSESSTFNLMPLTDHPSWLAGREYPDILIGTGFDSGRNKSYETNPFIAYPELLEPGLRYWDIFATSWRTVLGRPAEEHRVRLLRDFAGDVYINTTTTFDRELDGNWTGPGTNIVTAMRYDIVVGDRNVTLDNILDEANELKATKKSFRRRKYVMDVESLDAWAVCRGRKKQPCNDTQAVFEDSSSWCYSSVANDATEGAVQNSQDLLLLLDYERHHPRVWITEGPRAQNNVHFSPSIEVVLEESLSSSDAAGAPYAWPPEIDLIVCSITTVLRPATASGYDPRFSAQELTFLGNAHGKVPRTLIYHENWLDRAFNYFGTSSFSGDLNTTNSTSRVHKVGAEIYHGTQEGWNRTSSATVVTPDNFKYPPRSARTSTNNTSLRLFARAARNSIPPNGVFKGLGFDASQPEIVVGCAFVYALSWILPSNSRYSTSPSMLPDALKLVDPQRAGHAMINHQLTVYKERYGFRTSTVTGIMAAAILCAHATLSVIASVVHIVRKRSVINAWNSVAEYTALGVGSQHMVEALKNTCGGIVTVGTLQTLVKVRVRNTDHLEIVVEPGLERIGSGEYGFLVGGRAVAKEKMD